MFPSTLAIGAGGQQQQQQQQQHAFLQQQQVFHHPMTAVAAAAMGINQIIPPHLIPQQMVLSHQQQIIQDSAGGGYFILPQQQQQQQPSVFTQPTTPLAFVPGNDIRAWPPQLAVAPSFPSSSMNNFAQLVLNGGDVPRNFAQTYQMLLQQQQPLGGVATISPLIRTKRLASNEGDQEDGGEEEDAEGRNTNKRNARRAAALDEISSDGSEDEEDEDETTRPRSSFSKRRNGGAATGADRKPKFGLGGQKRLTINFTNIGDMCENPERFGKYNLVIPNGLCGTHTMYSQEWRFEILYSKGEEDRDILLTWKVTNLSSGKEIAVTETPQQAELRRIKGKTICNLVVKRALELRALDLEAALDKLLKSPVGNPMQVANLETLIKKLRPKQCTEGLLFFGLRHDIVQNRFKHLKSAMTDTNRSEAASVDSCSTSSTGRTH